MLLSTIIHEIGHTSACCAYGVEHGGIGVGFYLLTPVMFADVTSAWQLSAGKRIVVNLGGVYFELLFSVVLLLGYLIMDSIFFINASLVILIKMLYNLNPFFRTDGYWVLSDALNLPNLRKLSNEKVKLFCLNLVSKGDFSFGKNSWFLLLYGLSSYIFLFLFFYFVMFYHIGSLIYLPHNLAFFFYDLVTGEIVSVMILLNDLNNILIPFFFYYLLTKSFLLPIYRRLMGRE